ncbi:Uncharacterized protein FWK35_00015234 [Aphis craccivora]|uniref:Endonuclease/exonuclease/phosphatase domain-containing protein n=1 Tax=Aphis craccivora TaxID=307492 RepID=A0A6G0YBN2_APHCR|nr:Uncharacterized protein FWK35_00015234 [Aphis craccivora]
MVGVRIGQVNLGRGKLATDDLLSEIRERGLDVVLIQEPFVTGSGTFASLGRFPLRFITGNSPGEKPAAAVLVVNPSLGATLITQFSGTHVVIVEISSGDKSLYVGSAYFQFSEETDVHVERLESVIRDLGGADWLIGGDFNARSTLWNDTHTDGRGERVEDMIMSSETICCNEGSVPTFQTSMGSAILDLTLASVRVAASISGWKVHENAVTSDHRLITFGYDDIEEGEIEKQKGKRFNVRKADWNVFRQRLAEKRTLVYSHGVDTAAATNYVANVSRTLAYVQRRLVENKTSPEHWSALVTVDVNLYIEYFRLREEIGQTKATTINYLKNLRMLFHNIINSYIHEDPAFPKDFDLSPCVKTVTAIKLLDHKLGLVYKRTTKQQPGELFTRKTREAETLPEFKAVVESLRMIKGTINGNLRLLEDRFGNSGTVNVRTLKSVATGYVWTSKQRSGVAVGITIGEWESRRIMDTRSIITVAEHKTGDKEPATLVLQEDIGELMERGKKLVKIYDDVNKTFGARLSATLFWRMVETEGRDHDAVTSSGVAKALQHSEDTASRYYRVPDVVEAIRRQGNLDRVEHTALLKSYVDEQ